MTIITDPALGSIRGDRVKLRDRDLRAELMRVRKDKATRRRKFIYDAAGEPLGIVTFEPTPFDPKSGRRRPFRGTYGAHRSYR